MAKRFRALIEKMPPERQAHIEEWAQESLAEMALQELRHRDILINQFEELSDDDGEEIGD